MTKFHSDEYINFLRTVTPDNISDFSSQLQRCMSHPFAQLTPLKSTSAKTARCSMACFSIAKSRPEDRLVRELLGRKLMSYSWCREAQQQRSGHRN